MRYLKLLLLLTLPLAASPCMEELQKGNISSAEFWGSVEESGAPLIEPTGEGDYWVTFLWRGDDETQNVIIDRGPADGTLENSSMVLMAGTDVWYRTYRLSGETHTTYRLSPNDPLIDTKGMTPEEFMQQAQEIYANCQKDPLNSSVFIFTFAEGVEFPYSILQLPETPKQLECAPREDLPHGKVETHTFSSERLDNSRQIGVYTPPAYAESNFPYPLLILFDGENYLSDIPTPTILDNLIGEGKIPPVVALFVENVTPFSRGVEFPCNPDFGAFIAEELLPWAKSNYSITNDPQQRVVAGLSLGGHCAAYLAFTYPNEFGNVLSQSGYFVYCLGQHDEWLMEQYLESEPRPINFYMDAGALEKNSLVNRAPVLDTNRWFSKELQQKGYQVTYAEFEGGHDYICWRGTLAQGLIALLNRST